MEPEMKYADKFRYGQAANIKRRFDQYSAAGIYGKEIPQINIVPYVKEN